MNAASALPQPLDPRTTRRRRMLLWSVLVLLLAVAQSLLVAMTAAYENGRAQDLADAVATEAATDVRCAVQRALQDLQAVSWTDAGTSGWPQRARTLVQARREIGRVDRRTPALTIDEVADAPLWSWRIHAQAACRMPHAEFGVETELACAAARRTEAPSLCASYFVPMDAGLGTEVMDLCLPMHSAGKVVGFVVATFSLSQMLDATLGAVQARRHELSFVDSDRARLARAGALRGAGFYVAERVVDLPGRSLQLRADSAAGRPSPALYLKKTLDISNRIFYRGGWMHRTRSSGP